MPRPPGVVVYVLETPQVLKRPLRHNFASRNSPQEHDLHPLKMRRLGYWAVRSNPGVLKALFRLDFSVNPVQLTRYPPSSQIRRLRIKDSRVFDFSYIPEQLLMREEVKPIINTCPG